MLDTYRARQSELRKDDRALDAADLGASLANAMGHLPWEMQTSQDADFHQLHLAAFPDATKRPKRLGAVSWRNELIEES